jgi:hypothetical protein
MEKLKSTVDELEEKKRESEIALKVKTQTLEENKETFLHGSRFHESLYVLAGERFHADRLRPTVARAATPAPTVPPAGGSRRRRRGAARHRAAGGRFRCRVRGGGSRCRSLELTVTSIR